MLNSPSSVYKNIAVSYIPYCYPRFFLYSFFCCDTLFHLSFSFFLTLVFRFFAIFPSFLFWCFHFSRLFSFPLSFLFFLYIFFIFVAIYTPCIVSSLLPITFLLCSQLRDTGLGPRLFAFSLFKEKCGSAKPRPLPSQKGYPGSHVLKPFSLFGAMSILLQHCPLA